MLYPIVDETNYSWLNILVATVKRLAIGVVVWVNVTEMTLSGANHCWLRPESAVVPWLWEQVTVGVWGLGEAGLRIKSNLRLQPFSRRMIT
jgi:hypothetical protein